MTLRCDCGALWTLLVYKRTEAMCASPKGQNVSALGQCDSTQFVIQTQQCTSPALSMLPRQSLFRDGKLQGFVELEIHARFQGSRALAIGASASELS